MDIKGYGTISINKGGKIEKIPFTNTINYYFLEWVKSKFKNGETDATSKIDESDFEFIFNNGVNNFSHNGSSHSSLRSANGDISSSLSGATLTYKWDYNSNKGPVYWAVSDTNPLTVSSIKFKALYSDNGNKQEVGDAVVTGGSTYDYNDYVDSVEYSLSVSMTSSISGGVVLASDVAASSLYNGSSGPDIKPTQLKILNANNGVYVDQAVSYTNGQVTVNDLQIQNSLPPTKYELWVGSIYKFDEGPIVLSDPSVQDNAWISGDTINFQYSTDAFN